MPERVEVYATIDGQIDFEESSMRNQCIQVGREYVPYFNRTTEMYLSYITALNVDLLSNVSLIGDTKGVLDIFRLISSQCVSCIEFNGGCDRDVNTGGIAEFIEPILNRKRVYRMIDTERQYQDELGSNRTDGRVHTVEGYVVMFQHYLSEAHTDWVTKPGDEYCLNVVRKLAAIAVHAMEEHGVVLPETSNT